MTQPRYRVIPAHEAHGVTHQGVRILDSMGSVFCLFYERGEDGEILPLPDAMGKAHRIADAMNSQPDSGFALDERRTMQGHLSEMKEHLEALQRAFLKQSVRALKGFHERKEQDDDTHF